MGACCSVTARKDNFSEQYEISHGTLYEGEFGIVKRCTHKDTNERYCVKIVEFNGFQYDRILHVAREKKICLNLKHENIVRYRGCFFENHRYYVVFQEIRGRYIFAEICDKNEYSERDARNYMHQILSALKYCHERNIVHRDLKPRNILLRPIDDRIKLTEFGSAVIAGDNEKYPFGVYGALLFMAPEVIKNLSYGKPVDLWACGLLLHMLLAGYHPFVGDNVDDTRARMLRCDLDCQSIPGASEYARYLMGNLILHDDTQRLTAAQSLQDEFITAFENLSNIHLSSTLVALEKFHRSTLSNDCVGDMSRYRDESPPREAENSVVCRERREGLKNDEPSTDDASGWIFPIEFSDNTSSSSTENQPLPTSYVGHPSRGDCIFRQRSTAGGDVLDEELVESFSSDSASLTQFEMEMSPRETRSELSDLPSPERIVPDSGEKSSTSPLSKSNSKVELKTKELQEREIPAAISASDGRVRTTNRLSDLEKRDNQAFESDESFYSAVKQSPNELKTSSGEANDTHTATSQSDCSNVDPEKTM